MFVYELNREQMIELKQQYIQWIADVTGNEDPSYGELADVDNTITDQEIIHFYEGICFTDDDFFCTANW